MNNERIERLMNENLVGMGGAIPQRVQTRAVESVVSIPLDAIRPDPDNARKKFAQDGIEALAADLKRHGQLQNAIVFRDSSTGTYQLVAGERRWRAAKLAGLNTLECRVVPRELSEEILKEMAFAENMSRADLSPVEVAQHWKALMARWGCSTRELAARVGVSQSTVSKRLSLLKLDAGTRGAVEAGDVHQSNAIKATRTTRRPRAGAKPRRGVLELSAGTVRVRRGQTLEALAAELAEHLEQRERPAA